MILVTNIKLNILVYNNNAENAAARHGERIKTVKNATINMMVTGQILAEKANHGFQEMKETKENAKKTYKHIRNFFN